MTRLIIAMPGNDEVAHELASHLGVELGCCEIRRFPDGESFVRTDSEIKGREVAIAGTLDRPDDKFLTLSFLASTARELGAARVGLVAPYLAYMRQDKRFHPGEAVTSEHFARLLSQQFDWLVTMDPHLHRRKSLSEIYSIPTGVTHAGPAIADCCNANCEERAEGLRGQHQSPGRPTLYATQDALPDQACVRSPLAHRQISRLCREPPHNR